MANGSVAEASGSPDATPRTSANGGTKRRAGLSGMVLAELRELAGQLGITGTAGMRKGDLIAAIKERQGDSSAPAETLPLGIDAESGRSGRGARSKPADKAVAEEADAPAGGKNDVQVETKQDIAPADAPPESEDGNRRDGNRRRRSATRSAGSPEGSAPTEEKRPAEDKRDDRGGRGGDRQNDRGDRGERGGNDRNDRNDRGDRGGRGNDRNDRGDRQQDGRGRNDRNDRNADRNADRNDRNNGPDDDDDEDGRGRRGRRFRDRRRRGGSPGGGGRGENPDTEVREDDVLLPVAGVLDVLENYAFVRTSGYLSGPNDVYVSLSIVRKYGLRRGDAITGMVRQPR